VTANPQIIDCLYATLSFTISCGHSLASLHDGIRLERALQLVTWFPSIVVRELSVATGTRHW